MKGIFLFLSLLVAPLGFLHSATADDAADIARAATRRGTTNTVTNTRKKTENSPLKNSHSTNTVSRSTNVTPQTNNSLRERNVGNRSGNVISGTDRTTSTDTKKPSVTARSGTNIAPRATTARTATPAKQTIRTQSQTSMRATPRTNNRGTIARAATEAATAAREKIMSAKYTDCRTVYYDCMDEFCANKDSLLKRCACSARTNEFTGVQKQLTQAEEKLLDFGERLLTVNLEAEDATAMFNATAGELAFQKPDTTTSKKILDEIAEKLNTKIDNSTFDRTLSPISLSLNEDAAWDSVDSLQGASTTLKSGTELYAAALPICREMALEICTPDELDIIESGYQMAIEQDCNTVAKSYVNQTDAAREKIRESSALLDMARLDIYQKRNSDDILTCKTKMLDMLTNTSVCGENLGKCLDTTGQYIDPSTGEAFLTMNLGNLAHLITRPTGNQTWTNAPGNAKFVSYLYSKKQYLEPAMENCQDVADYVWDNFIEDALAQIKLAQDAKLEEVRQSCTTLTTQCLSDTAKSLADFDARALSTFGVAADKTVNAMCADVQNACTALLQETGGGDGDWVGGMTEIATDTTYETLRQTCREVGRACIIQACTSISGNFGLCENIDTSINRKAIINRTSCWNEVLSCVKSAGTDSIDNIITLLGNRGSIKLNNGAIDTTSFYSNLYGSIPEPYISDIGNPGDCEKTENKNCVYDICYNDCNTQPTSFECRSCRIAEQIWGNCEVAPTTTLSTKEKDDKGNIKMYHNRIKAPVGKDATTLLYWFAVNTGTNLRDDACRDTTCGPGFIPYEVNGIITCQPSNSVDDSGAFCPKNADGKMPTYSVNGVNLCCPLGTDSYSNCCNGTPGDIDATNATTNLCYMSNTNNTYTLAFDIATADTQNYYFNGRHYLICFGGSVNTDNTYFKCDGNWVIVSTKSGHYYTPKLTNSNDETFINTGLITETFRAASTTDSNGIEQPGIQYTYQKSTDATDGKWHDANENTVDEPDNWMVTINAN